MKTLNIILFLIVLFLILNKKNKKNKENFSDDCNSCRIGYITNMKCLKQSAPLWKKFGQLSNFFNEEVRKDLCNKYGDKFENAYKNGINTLYECPSKSTTTTAATTAATTTATTAVTTAATTEATTAATTVSSQFDGVIMEPGDGSGAKEIEITNKINEKEGTKEFTKACVKQARKEFYKGKKANGVTMDNAHTKCFAEFGMKSIKDSDKYKTGFIGEIPKDLKYMNNLIAENQDIRVNKCVNVNPNFTGAKFEKVTPEQRNECRKIKNLPGYGYASKKPRIDCLNKNTWIDQNKKDMKYLCSQTDTNCDLKDVDDCENDHINTWYGSKVSGCCKIKYDKDGTFQKIFKSKLKKCSNDNNCIDNLCKNLNEQNCLDASDLKKEIYDMPEYKCGFISNKDKEWNPSSNLEGNTCRRKDIADSIVTKCENGEEDCIENRCNNHKKSRLCKKDNNCVDVNSIDVYTKYKKFTAKDGSYCRSKDLLKKEIGYDPSKTKHPYDCSLQCMFSNKICGHRYNPTDGTHFSQTLDKCCPDDKDYLAISKNKEKLNKFIKNFSTFCKY